MDFSKITDQILEAVDVKMMDCITDKLPIFLNAVNVSMDHTKPAHLAVQESAARYQKETDKIADAIMVILNKELKMILPDAEFWVNGKSRPKGDLSWVINPFSSALMAKMSIGIALLHQETLRIGLVWDLTEQAMYIGVQGEDASCNEEIIKVSERKATPASRSMNFAIGPDTNLSPKQMRQFLNFGNSLDQTLLRNDQEANMVSTICKVAKGKDDFTLAYGTFQYPSIAAALCVAERAGAKVTDFEGQQEGLFSGNTLCCANKKVHQQFMNCAIVDS